MGIKLADIVGAVVKDRKLENFSGKTIAIDAANALYQFLSVIRQADGQPPGYDTKLVTACPWLGCDPG